MVLCIPLLQQSAGCGIVFSRSVTHVIYTEDRTGQCTYLCVFVGRGDMSVYVFLVYSTHISSEATELYTTLRNTETRPEKSLCKLTR